MMTMLAGKLESGREGLRAVAGKSTLNRLELSKLAPTRYTAPTPPPSHRSVATHSVLRYWGSMLANFTRLA
jgi:hypothetical protein